MPAPPLPPATARRVALGLAAGRAALGLLAVATPRSVLRPWIGDRAGDTGARVIGRALGARDLGLGAGALLAARHAQPVRGWIEGGALADAGDALFTLLAFRSLPRRGRWAVAGAAGAGAVTAVLTSPLVDGAAVS